MVMGVEPVACATPVPSELGNAVAVSVKLPVFRLLNVVCVWFPERGRGINWDAIDSVPRVKVTRMLLEARGISLLLFGQTMVRLARRYSATAHRHRSPLNPSLATK